MRANSEGSGETALMRRLAWAFAGRLCDKYHNIMSWLKRDTITCDPSLNHPALYEKTLRIGNEHTIEGEKFC